ncbi:MAG: hypothetical protein WCF46_05015 [Nitrososphaeraceae archaeon]
MLGAVLAWITTNGKQEEQEVSVNEIVVGDTIVVKPGETVLTVSVVVYGESSMDESMITGESIPVDKKVSDGVIGYLRIKAGNIGSHTVFANIVEMVEQAGGSKPLFKGLQIRLLCILYR